MKYVYLEIESFLASNNCLVQNKKGVLALNEGKNKGLHNK